MSTLPCLGGPLAGQSVPDVGYEYHCQLPDPHHGLTILPRGLSPCLELQEIKALTGRDHHRDPRRVIAEHHERQQVLRRHYVKQRFFNEREKITVAAYVFEGYEPSQEELRGLSEMAADPLFQISQKSRLAAQRLAATNGQVRSTR